jgi:hypothetical protein
MAAAGKRDPEARWRKVRAEMERNAYHLMRRGNIAAKWACGGRRWVLRFAAPDGRGRLVNRSLYLGSDENAEVVRHARALLGYYRATANWLEQIRLSARLGTRAAAILRLPGRRRGSARRRSLRRAASLWGDE